MSHDRLTISLLALALFAHVSAGVYRTSHVRTNVSETPRADFVVATRDIVIGKRIEQGDVSLSKLPGNSPAACFRDKSLVVGHRVILPISEGNPVCPSHLAIKDEDTFTWPPDMRAVSVAVGEIVGTTGFLEAGTHVDVLLSRTLKGRRERTTTVLKNVCEIVVAQVPSTGSLRPSVSVLLLSPDDAQKLARVRRRGEIRLSVLHRLQSCM